MSPINIICTSCGMDVLVEPEVELNEDAICPECKGPLHEGSLTITEMPAMPKWMDSINRFENAVIAQSWAGSMPPENAPATRREYADARVELIGQFVTLQNHSRQAGELADTLAKIDEDDDNEITVGRLHSLGAESYMETQHGLTELLNDHLEDVASTHGRPFGQS